MRIDAHQHFWEFDAIRDNWINDSMQVIQKDFLPNDLKPLLDSHGFEGCIAVQSNASEAENAFQLKNASLHDFIKGVVGWIDPRAKNLRERLAYYSTYNKMKGFRYGLQGEEQRNLMLDPVFMKGIGLLKNFGFTYDILIYADQLKYIPEFTTAFPEQKFVLDHIGKPDIKHHKINDWKKDIAEVAKCPNVYCKISGMITEAAWQQWKQADFIPYLDVVTEVFGINRIMYGSDWPMCELAGGYQPMLGVVEDYFSSYSENEQELFFGGNANAFYGL
ncbi:MAG: amidohydrolase family protein [Chitinophagaceae bacterium]|nr:amidohydrolase family protein [Chitinophagaceae bacterium]